MCTCCALFKYVVCKFTVRIIYKAGNVVIRFMKLPANLPFIHYERFKMISLHN